MRGPQSPSPSFPPHPAMFLEICFANENLSCLLFFFSFAIPKEMESQEIERSWDWKTALLFARQRWFLCKTSDWRASNTSSRWNQKVESRAHICLLGIQTVVSGAGGDFPMGFSQGFESHLWACLWGIAIQFLWFAFLLIVLKHQYLQISLVCKNG